MIIDQNDRQELIQQYLLIVMQELKVKNLSGIVAVREFLKDFNKLIYHGKRI